MIKRTHTWSADDVSTECQDDFSANVSQRNTDENTLDEKAWSGSKQKLPKH